MNVAIPSRGRSDTIGQHTLKLFPDAFVVVDEAEAADYEPVVRKERLLLHPGVQPLSKIFNWILDNASDKEGVALVGDDMNGLYAMPGWSARRYSSDPEVCQAVVQNAAECCREAGAAIFGFAANANPIVFEPGRPFNLARWVASPIGFVGKHGLRFDERLSLMGDVDICLQSLQKHRILWCDRRWAFVGKALTNKGGSAHLRSEDAFAAERAILKEKWGPYVRFDTEALHSSARYKQGLPATTLMTYVYVPRVQAGF